MTTRRSTWRVPIALAAIGTVPVIAGSLALCSYAIARVAGTHVFTLRFGGAISHSP
jgi:hypothetical protein